MPDEAKKVMVPMRVEWVSGWLTWVGATTSCLRALGVECDQVDVAAMSGYAFVLNVRQDVDVSGPTAFDWALLTEGVRRLGRSTTEFHAFDMEGTDPTGELRVAGCRAAYELVAREVREGRPCVIWGAYQPEFGVAVGVEDGFYEVLSFREDTGQPETPIKFDELANPSGPYALAFPTPTKATPERADAWAIGHGLRLLAGRSGFPDYAFGLAAYDEWIAAIEANRAQPYGHTYSAQCFAEGRRFAREFLTRVAKRNAAVAEPLGRAVAAYTEASSAMDHLAKLFPWPPGDQLKDPANRTYAAELLRAAKAAETRAVAALTEAFRHWSERLPAGKGE